MKALKWRRLAPTIITKIDHRHIVVKTFALPHTNEQLTFATYQLEGARAAGVIALTPDHMVITARQFRHGPERIMDEIAGGGVEDGEEPEAAARRELLEETGYMPGKLEFLGATCRDAYHNGTWFYYLATDCVPSPKGPKDDKKEPVEVRLLPISTFLRNAKRGDMTDPAAVLMAYDKLRALAE